MRECSCDTGLRWVFGGDEGRTGAAVLARGGEGGTRIKGGGQQKWAQPRASVSVAAGSVQHGLLATVHSPLRREAGNLD